MWFLFQRRATKTPPCRRKQLALSKVGRIEQLEERALLSTVSCAGDPVAAEIRILDGEVEKHATAKLIDVNGTFPIHSGAGNSGTFTFVQNGQDVTLTPNTTHYPSGTVNLHFKTDHSKKAKGPGEFTFAGDIDPTPIFMKIRFKPVTGDLDFKYKYKEAKPR